MAVAGMHNVLAYCPPFFGESQSPVSRAWGEEPNQPSSRASSLLQMWREIEGEHVAGHSPRPSHVSDSDHSSTITSDGQRSDNGDDCSEDASEIENQVRTRLENDHEDSNSIISEQSTDLGEFERERVRQIFREWNCGTKSHSTSGSCMDKRSGPQWLAENECERVRVIREWVQKNTQQGSSCGSHRDGVAEVGSQFEQVRDGLAVNHFEVGARRPIRRLCGRQTLLDLLLRAQRERRRELQGLSEKRPVSEFVYRNRIQALLRGRFLRNERSISDERPCSLAASELGMLSQRHAVSDLREGFLSRLDNSSQILMNRNNEHRDVQELIDSQSGPTCGEWESTVIYYPAGDSERGTDENIIQQEFVIEGASEVEEPVLDNEEILQEASTDVEQAGSRHGIENIDTGTIAENNANERSLENVDVDGSEHLEVFAENYEHRTQVNYDHEVAGYSDHVEQNAYEEFDRQDSSAQLEELQESVIENEESSWQQLTGVPFSEWTDGRGWQRNSANQRFQETSGNDGVEHGQMQQSHEDWQGHDLQEAIDSWLDVPSGEDSATIERFGGFYFSDDDNVYSMELRELFSRRRVSSLLRSGFCESLNQILQSHVERQGLASSDWDDNASSSLTSTEQVEEQINHDQDSAQDGTERNPFIFSSQLGNALLPLLDEELQDANWQCYNSEQCLGIEWEVINELRIDMARLQQRMDNMQRTLEACMDMQIELQRALRQEVSAALNRSSFSSDKLEGTVPKDESQWNHVKKGICCLCQDGHIDSLLYRCGHMCTCSKCAHKLVQSTGKCPMCQAPVVEAVQAYFIQ